MEPPARIRIERPAPAVDGGRHPAKRTVGDLVEVSALIFRDGHETLRAVVRHRPAGGGEWGEAPLRRIDAHLDGDTWAGAFRVDREGAWEWTIQAWVDAFASWQEELRRKVDAGQQDLAGELSEGVVLLREACGRAAREDKARIERALALVEDAGAEPAARHAAALDPALLAAVERDPERREAVTLEPYQPLAVARERARFGAWYELFPRSWGGFQGVQEQLPRFAELGFDVLYLPPIHPIGHTNRKGANNALAAAPEDPGSPWAIGDETGGHDAIHPGLGTEEDFRALVAAAREHDLEIALDFAIQCSADHPWLTEHPEWFHHRPDGTLKYAENPPKRYQDIYNVNFACADWRGLWQALLDVVLHWVGCGVRIFRVDNPHTKPLPFWEWLIGEVRREHPDVLFLAEAFTRSAMMNALAKLGFDQSYTYFTWKNSRWELTEYLHELVAKRDYFRPNFFANTPDILNAYLVDGGPPAFAVRLVLAATLSPTYGIYSGFERFENVPVRAGSEEYLDSEKYEVKRRRLDGPLLPFVAQLNRIRREHRALQRLENVWFLETENDALLAYAKRAGPADTLLVVVNLDPRYAQEGVAIVPVELGLPLAFPVRDLISGERFDWHVGRNYVRLDPFERAAHILAVEGP